MKKAIVVVIGVLALTFATMSFAFAAPTQKATLTCKKNGNTYFTIQGGSIDSVNIAWYGNSTSEVLGQFYNQKVTSWSTPNSAKTAKATIYWSGNGGLGYTDYAVACK